MQVDPGIFKAYDIRGIYNETLSDELAENIGRAFAKLLQEENEGKRLSIMVTRDMRISSPVLANKVIEGLIKSGVDVVDAGMTSTPTFYFGVAFYGYDGGIQISASHNPSKYNGFKMVRSRGIPVSGESGIKKIRDWIINGDLGDPVGDGSLQSKSGVLVEQTEVQKKWSDWSSFPDYKIVIDPANGMGCMDAEAMFKDTNCSIIKLNFELDGTFPAHEADPLKPENLTMLRKAVIENKADLGIAIDGDADRYFFIDENGEVFKQEILRGLIGQQILKRFPGEKIGYDIRPGRSTTDMVKAAGGIPITTRVGHSLIKEQMLKEDMIFSGESSGHYFFKQDYGTFEAPVILTGLVLDSLYKSGKKISELWKPFDIYFNSGEINSEVKDVQGKIMEIKDKYVDGKQSNLDGISVEYDDWWFNVRPSNTEPKLRLVLEAKSQKLMEEKRDELLILIRN